MCGLTCKLQFGHKPQKKTQCQAQKVDERKTHITETLQLKSKPKPKNPERPATSAK